MYVRALRYVRSTLLHTLYHNLINITVCDIDVLSPCSAHRKPLHFKSSAPLQLRMRPAAAVRSIGMTSESRRVNQMFGAEGVELASHSTRISCLEVSWIYGA